MAKTAFYMRQYRTHGKSAYDKAVAAFENKVRGLSREESAVVDSGGNILFQRRGDATSVGYTTNQISQMEGNVLLHNHPADYTFSVSDVQAINWWHLSGLRATNKNGTHELMQASPNADSGGLLKAYAAYHNSVANSAESLAEVNRIQNLYNRRQLSRTQAQRMIDQNVNIPNDAKYAQWLKQNASKYGFKYSFK